jgi:hypothetical protein
VNSTHLHNAERNCPNGLTTLPKSVVGERIIYPTNDAGGVDDEMKVAVRCETLDDDVLRASIWRRGNDCVFGEEIVWV